MNDEVFIFLAFFSAIAFVVYTMVTAGLRRMQLKATAEFNIRLLDRIGSIKDFNEFLQTEGGAKFMSSLTAATAARPGSRPSQRILLASQIGAVMSTVGVGFLVLKALLAFNEPSAVGFTVIGVVALSIGLGFLVSSAMSYWLANRLGVLDSGEDRAFGDDRGRNVRDVA